MSPDPEKLPTPDYEADDVLVVAEPQQLRALGDDVRMKIVLRLRGRAASTTELAAEFELAKGTVGHHLKVLERAGLIRVVRTRQVRALTEKFYGRVARLFVIKSTDEMPEGPSAVAAATLRQAAEEVAPVREQPLHLSLLHVQLEMRDVQRFVRRLEKLADDLQARPSAPGRRYGVVLGLYHTEDRDA